MKEQHNYLHIMKANPNQLYVLATVVQVDGSAYRHEGAKMLFSETGEEYGLISGGCLEEDLAYHVNEVMKSKQPKIVSYDLRSEDDLGWGQGAGCNGKVYVYLETMQWTDNRNSDGWPEVLEELEKGKSVVAIRECHKDGFAHSHFFNENGAQTGAQSQVVDLPVQIVEDFHNFNREGKKFFYLKEPKGNGSSSYIFEVYEPKDILYVFGAGPDVEPVVKRAAEFSFSIVVVDPREVRCNKQNFPDATSCVCEHTESFMENHRMKHNSYVLIMTHSFERDRYLLQRLLSKQDDLAYMGILGPKRRTKRLLDGGDIPEWIHSPVGVDIHAEGAEEISVSILAELLAVRNKRKVARSIKLAVV